eukprot:g1680.t1
MALATEKAASAASHLARASAALSSAETLCSDFLEPPPLVISRRRLLVPDSGEVLRARLDELFAEATTSLDALAAEKAALLAGRVGSGGQSSGNKAASEDPRLSSLEDELEKLEEDMTQKLQDLEGVSARLETQLAATAAATAGASRSSSSSSSSDQAEKQKSSYNNKKKAQRLRDRFADLEGEVAVARQQVAERHMQRRDHQRQQHQQQQHEQHEQRRAGETGRSGGGSGVGVGVGGMVHPTGAAASPRSPMGKKKRAAAIPVTAIDGGDGSGGGGGGASPWWASAARRARSSCKKRVRLLEVALERAKGVSNPSPASSLSGAGAGGGAGAGPVAALQEQLDETEESARHALEGARKIEAGNEALKSRLLALLRHLVAESGREGRGTGAGAAAGAENESGHVAPAAVVRALQAILSHATANGATAGIAAGDLSMEARMDPADLGRALRWLSSRHLLSSAAAAKPKKRRASLALMLASPSPLSADGSAATGGGGDEDDEGVSSSQSSRASSDADAALVQWHPEILQEVYQVYL